ncbi:hypothetical protein Bca4012_011396 [Brassica carinata]
MVMSSDHSRSGRDVGVDADNGWCYVACFKCSRNYRVEMAIADDTAEGTFVCFRLWPLTLRVFLPNMANLRASDAAQMLTFTVTRIVDEIVRQPEPDVADNGGDDDGVTTSQFLLWFYNDHFLH